MNEETKENKRTAPPQFCWWIITYNNPPDNWKKALEDLPFDYVIGQLEVGEQGTYHIQAAGYIKKGQRLSFFKKYPMHVQGVPSRDAAKIMSYCTKLDTRDQDPVEFGIRPKLSVGRTPSVKPKDYDGSLQLCKEGRLGEIEANILIPHFTNLQKLSAYFGKPSHSNELRGLWWYGPPGTGKSRTAHELYPDLYPKSQNKWWDNYAAQETVLLDDFDKGGACLSHFIKIWTDHYPCFGEIKGGSVALVYDRFIITSNYQPEDLWGDDPILCEAIRRRFQFRYFGKDVEQSPAQDLLFNIDSFLNYNH